MFLFTNLVIIYNFLDPNLDDRIDSSLFIRIPICPNGLSAMQYADGRPVMCLPGKNQCPDKSVCYFNGLDYFCCPNEGILLNLLLLKKIYL